MKNAAHSAMPAPAVMMKLGVADHIAQVVKVASFRDRHFPARMLSFLATLPLLLLGACAEPKAAATIAADGTTHALRSRERIRIVFSSWLPRQRRIGPAACIRNGGASAGACPRQSGYQAVVPPSTGMIAPVTNRLASEASHTAAPLMSLSPPGLPSGISRSIFSGRSS